MTAPDGLRSRLRGAATSMPVGSGSLAGVQLRAAQLQRRRNAARGSVGALALVAVALVGVVSLRSGQVGDYETSAEAVSETETTTLSAATAAAAESYADEDMADDADSEFDAAQSEGLVQDLVQSQSEEQLVEESAVSAAASPDSEASAPASADEPEAAGESENWETVSPARSDPETAVFAKTVSIVPPPAEAEGADMHYSFSGAHAVARAADSWYAYDGEDWQSVGLPDDMEVVAVDLSGAGRIAVFGVVRPLGCARTQVIAVRTDGRWSYVRIDDDTPPTVGWELLDARIRVTDTAIELERVERLWLDDQCADPSGYDAPTDAAAELVADLERFDEMQRDSWLHAPLEGGFAQRWQEVARSDAHAAAVSDADLAWTTANPPRYTIAAMRLTPSTPIDDSTAAVALHETTVMDVATTVHVSDGMAMLQRGDQTWEVCPIHPDEIHAAHGAIGQAGEHLAVVVGKPEQTLFVIERAE